MPPGTRRRGARRSAPRAPAARDTKAAEYADDERNAHAAQALQSLADWVGALPDTDPIVVRILAALDTLYADPDVHTGFVPTVSERLGRYGFHDGGLPTRADHRVFIAELAKEIERHVSRQS